MKRIITILTFACLIMAATSCEHKDLCYDHSHLVNVKVVFNWQYAPEAAPASVSLYLFSKEDGSVRRYEFTDYNGGTIQVPIGEYDAMCLNSDTEDVTYDNTDALETFEVKAYTTTLLSKLTSLGLKSENAPRASGTEDERVSLSPDMLWSDHLEDIVLDLTDETVTVTLYPEQSVCSYDVTILNGENLKYVIGITGSVSTLAGGLLPGQGSDVLTDETVTIPFDVYTEEDMTTLTAEFLTFGHCPTVDYTHILTIYAVLSDGTKWYYTYDVTDQIHDAADRLNVHIVLDGLPLPEPIVNGGGFQPEVDEWQDVEIDIPM